VEPAPSPALQNGREFLCRALCPHPDSPADTMKSFLSGRFYPAFFCAAQRAFIKTDNFFRAAGLIGRRGLEFLGAAPLLFFCLAHRAFCAAEILARAEALMVRRFGFLAAIVFFEPAGRPGPRWGERWSSRAEMAFAMRSLCCRSSVSMSSRFMRFLSWTGCKTV
jgi:hypothetical protein